ncbi:MAG: POTRA domain-containing protein, partial [Alphaproteobacteria bacterium]
MRELIRDSSNLNSLTTTPPPNAAGLVRRAMEDRDRVTAALYAFGYYGGTVTITAAGVPVTSADAVAAVERVRKSGPVPVRIGVALGPQFRFGRVRFEDAETRSPLVAPLSGEALGIEPGKPARATAITAAELLLTATMRKEGYPFAAVTSRDVVADHANGTVDIAYNLRRGPKAAFGEVQVEGTERLDP